MPTTGNGSLTATSCERRPSPTRSASATNKNVAGGSWKNEIFRYDYTYYLLAKGAIMPNWCSNSLHISGDEAQLRDFLERITITDEEGHKGYSILPRLYPTPEELQITSTSMRSPEPNPKWLEWVADGTWTQAEYDERVAEDAELYAKQLANIAKYGYRDWYEWCVEKWGTKWGDCDTELLDASDTIDMRFDSAWSPPVDGIIHISTLFPNLLFSMSWAEEGMDFYGGMAVKNGQHALHEGEITALPNYTEVDWDSDNAHDQWEKVSDAILEAREACEIKAMKEVSA